MLKNILRTILRWIIPILLAASCYGWIWPRGTAYEEVINPSIRIVCQIVGLICVSLLGPWWLLVFSCIWNFWIRASFGILGICLAGFILIGMGLDNLYVYYGCGGLQIIWLIFVRWYYSWDKIIVSGKDFKGRLHKEMISLFGRGYAILVPSLSQMCGFCFFVFLTSFGWFIATVGSTGYPGIHIYMMKGILISLGLLMIFGPGNLCSVTLQMF